jgi:hypothetical protein
MPNSNLIETYCLQKDLATYDPYDIWKEPLGVAVRRLFYKNKTLGIIPAGLLTIWDLFVGDKFKIVYQKQEYPIVRGLAALTLLNRYQLTQDANDLYYAKLHLEWLKENSSIGYSGYCWGINFVWSSKNGVYPKGMPHVTHTVYVLEAFVKYRNITGDNCFDDVITSVYLFLEHDILVFLENTEQLALSYAPVNEPRIVINANSYIMYMYSLLLPFFPEHREYIQQKIMKLYRFVISHQHADGSWYYYAETDAGNFIDCFHSCFVIKNIIKTNANFPLGNIEISIQKGYDYIKNNFYDEKTQLYRRFSVADKPSMITFDLYDNAEMMALASLLNDQDTLAMLKVSISTHFVTPNTIYSHIDKFGFKHGKDTLRWAVMPYLYAESLP